MSSFHSEFKTDMDLTRLPSGKFDTNYVVCAGGRGDEPAALGWPAHAARARAPVRRSAAPSHIRTVIQELMFKAARMVDHARQWVLGLGANDRAFAVFERHWRALDAL